MVSGGTAGNVLVFGVPPWDDPPIHARARRVTDANPPGRPPLNWLWLVTLALVVGVAPAVGRDVTADLRESWGRWPAILAGPGSPRSWPS